MNPLRYPLLADANVNPTVVQRLKAQGKTIRTLANEGLVGATDLTILRHAHECNLVVLTHGSDFGRIAIEQETPIVGVIQLRPGHISPDFAIEALEAVSSAPIDVDGPFVIVAHRQRNEVRIRVRSTQQLSPERAPKILRQAV